MEAVVTNRSILLRPDHWLPLTIIVLAALWLRTYDLGQRPMHADEANQAVKTGELLESGRYEFDPLDHHGPTLYYAALPVAWSRSEKTLATLSEVTVRLVPAVCGTLSVLLLAFLAAPLGRWPALAAAAFFAVSPPAVYYSRYFIQETLLLTFTLGTLVCAVRWWWSGAWGWAVGAGICVGLMQSTKASAPLFWGAFFIALATAGAGRPETKRPWHQLGIAVGAALAVMALFYSSFGTHAAGLRDAVLTYSQGFQRVNEGNGHEKPWWYYLQLFTWQRNGGLVWEQLAFSTLAVAGAIIAFATKEKFLRWWAVYTGVVAVVLSLTPYKTPWHAVHLVPGLAVLAAGVIAIPRQWWAGAGLAVGVIALLAGQTRLAVFKRPADSRNPYAYVHSSADVLKYRALAEAAIAASPQGAVRVIAEEYWPLPWYLRGLPQVGYWFAPPAECDGAIVFASANYADSVRARLHGVYRESYLGLRPDFIFVVFTPQINPGPK